MFARWLTDDLKKTDPIAFLQGRYWEDGDIARTHQALRSLEDSEEAPSSPVCVTGVVAAYL